MITELKIKEFSVREVAQAVNGRLVRGDGDVKIKCISSNSKDGSEGLLFIAIKGENFDGHDYIGEACGNGAVCVIAERNTEKCTCALITVDDSVKALGLLGKYNKKLSDVKTTVAVTGSVGKTTTKNFIASVLETKYKTRKSAGNHNNKIGVPLTLLSLEKGEEMLVLEFGMSAPLEIEHLSLMCEPDYAVITNIGTSHMQFLGSRENICRAKMEITHGMKDGSVLFLNSDDALLVSQTEGNFRIKKYGVYGKTADYRATNIRDTENGSVYDVLLHGNVLENVGISVLGSHNIYNSLAALALCETLGVDADNIKKGLLSYTGESMRQDIYDIHGVTVIEDCYNASPESMRAGIEVLMSVSVRKQGRACALLGDMTELGEDIRFMHGQTGYYAAKSGVKVLFAYGEMAETIAESAVKNGIRAENVYAFADTSRPGHMAEMMRSALKAGDVLLVKASRATALENVLTEYRKSFEKRK